MTRRAYALEIVHVRRMTAIEQGPDVIDFDSRRLAATDTAVLAQRASLEDVASYRCPPTSADPASSLIGQTSFFATMFGAEASLDDRRAAGLSAWLVTGKSHYRCFCLDCLRSLFFALRRTSARYRWPSFSGAVSGNLGSFGFSSSALVSILSFA